MNSMQRQVDSSSSASQVQQAGSESKGARQKRELKGAGYEEQVAALAGEPARGAEPGQEEPLCASATFALGKERHRLTATYQDGEVTVIMESIPKKIQDKFDELRASETLLINSLSPGPDKSAHEAIVTDLDGLEGWFGTEELKIKTQKNKAKIGPDLKQLVLDLMAKIVTFGNKHKLTDFVYGCFGVDKMLQTIDNQVNKELRKHLGQSGTLGDGHNNTATAAELLGVVTGYSQRHDTRTATCRDKLIEVITQLEQLEHDFGIPLTSLTEYHDAVEERDGCILVLSDPATYLKQRGFKVESGSVVPL